MSRGADIVSVVEAGYRLDLSGAAWLEEVARAAGPQLMDGLGAFACFFDRDVGDPSQIVSSVTNIDSDDRLLASLRAAFEMGTREDRNRSLRLGGPVIRLSDLSDTPLLENPFYAELAKSIGFSEMFAIRAMNPDGKGAFFATPTRPGTRRNAEWIARWSLVSAHLSAALRLQQAAKATQADASAILTPAGRVLSLSKGAENARDVLRDAAVEMDRSRSKRGRKDERTALAGWRALVDGRWSLVDHFESDGKRHIIAVENAPLTPDPRALTPEERPVLHYVAMGHANKLIAYELGIPQGTVATRIAAIMRKLGVGSRVEIVDRYMALTQMEFARVGTTSGAAVYSGASQRGASKKEALLTPAEREVTGLARRGLSNREIAVKRKCAQQTVTNIMSAAFKKLGVSSRAELGRLEHQR